MNEPLDGAGPTPDATLRRTASPTFRLLASPIGRLAVITVLIFVALALLAPSRFVSVGNLTSMAFQFPEFALLSLAMMLAMLTGGIDLSVVGIANLSAILAGLALHAAGPEASAGTATLAIGAAIVVSLAVGAVCGVINGLTIGRFALPPILATLGSGLIYTGLGVAITGGSAVLGFPAAFAIIGNGSLGIVPVPLILFAVAAVGVAFLLGRTAYGIRIELLGTNPLASRFAGIDDFMVTVKTYVLSGMLAALAGLVVMSRANSAKADYGSSYMLLSILICVLGGINPNGGFGKVSGLVLAVLSLQFLSSGLNMLQVSNFAREFIWGGLLLIVMVVNTFELVRHRR
ncbi:ABC transporter permease [Siculibacillus lacustris]|uniref:ABC transporter permease n=1 Tax=Siculibacillus lacustris TaxID=1549641 RepID=A0A4Q9VPS9_9HYPH|nr:ABC transporter permease [Siculibacillus lacustris]TBW37629.1 ABC transporter permease [Siculibacillus lacustris]